MLSKEGTLDQLLLHYGLILLDEKKLFFQIGK